MVFLLFRAVPLSHFLDARRMGELCGSCRGSKTRGNGRFMDAKGMKRRTHPFRGQQSDARTQREGLRRQLPGGRLGGKGRGWKGNVAVS